MKQNNNSPPKIFKLERSHEIQVEATTGLQREIRTVELYGGWRFWITLALFGATVAYIGVEPAMQLLRSIFRFFS